MFAAPIVSRRCFFLAKHRFSHRLLSTARPHMPTLPEIASERCGVPPEKAFAIDDVNLYEKLGQDAFVKLSTEFYSRVYDDGTPVDVGEGKQLPFNQVFGGFKKENSIQNQYEFLIQRLGGPPLYSQRRGHPALPVRHARFPCTVGTSERYMEHMAAALEAVPEIDPDSRERIYNYFRHTCYFLAVGQEVMHARRMEVPNVPQQQGQAQAAAAAAPQQAQAATAAPQQQRQHQPGAE